MAIKSPALVKEAVEAHLRASAFESPGAVVYSHDNEAPELLAERESMVKRDGDFLVQLQQTDAEASSETASGEFRVLTVVLSLNVIAAKQGQEKDRRARQKDIDALAFAIRGKLTRALWTSLDAGSVRGDFLISAGIPRPITSLTFDYGGQSVELAVKMESS